MILILIGAPGAGKGTQADKLVEETDCYKISTGDALRRQISLGTEIGKLAESFINEGNLVPDDVLLGVLKAELSGKEDKLVLLDGYPRNLQQAKTLETLKSNYPVSNVIHLDVGSELLMKRLTGRRVCSGCGASYHMISMPPAKEGLCDRCGESLYQRKDDREDKIRTRLEVYDRETSPVLDFYKEKDLYTRVNAEGPASDVFKQLKKFVNA